MEDAITIGRLTTYLPNNEGICTFAIMEEVIRDEDIEGDMHEYKQYHLANRPLLIPMDGERFTSIADLLEYYRLRLEAGVTMSHQLTLQGRRTH